MFAALRWRLDLTDPRNLNHHVEGVRIPPEARKFCLVTRPKTLAQLFEWWQASRGTPPPTLKAEIVAGPHELEIRYFLRPAGGRAR